jgi:BCD family chlorophyll transporter-like MFS transporter
VRILVAIGMGTLGFTMQDILLEPYGAQVLGLDVGETTRLTALLAGGTLLGFSFAAFRLSRLGDPYRLAALGALAGIAGLSAVIVSGPLLSPAAFRAGAGLVGFGTGLFMIGTMTAAMTLAREGGSGLALGAWGAVQATATGIGIALGGTIRDVAGAAAESGALGEVLADVQTGYSLVYHLEILLLFATLVALGPLVRPRRGARPLSRFGLDDVPA